ncbi:hypothetical protein NEFER03_1254 [Nematocida sp. LUAm3]|nr:hypothetical protein NEFER03_1254 [Nematocida sp. LUAm3]KAI5174124.1 hypothetical protein NEFER02_0591 [Nematocida sp. LUAm2]KAI5177133.1 hypothetical protein NEFER01_0408 [Nematocida sp. LUAm1]
MISIVTVLILLSLVIATESMQSSSSESSSSLKIRTTIENPLLEKEDESSEKEETFSKDRSMLNAMKISLEGVSSIFKRMKDFYEPKLLLSKKEKAFTEEEEGLWVEIKGLTKDIEDSFVEENALFAEMEATFTELKNSFSSMKTFYQQQIELCQNGKKDPSTGKMVSAEDLLGCVEKNKSFIDELYNNLSQKKDTYIKKKESLLEKMQTYLDTNNILLNKKGGFDKEKDSFPQPIEFKIMNLYNKLTELTKEEEE